MRIAGGGGGGGRGRGRGGSDKRLVARDENGEETGIVNGA
jgi:hypothetical protein